MGWLLAFWLFSGRRRVTVETVAERKHREDVEGALLVTLLAWVGAALLVMSAVTLPLFLRGGDVCIQDNNAPPWHAVTTLMAGC